MKRISLEDLSIKPFCVLNDDWALLVGGAGEKANPMTVSWGGMGTFWHRPVVTVYVRPTRYTYELLEEHREFTLNFMPEEFKGAMEICGSVSGRDCNKWEKAGITPERSVSVETPRIKEARLSFECRVIGFSDIYAEKILDKEIFDLYPKKDFHRIYFGEVTAAFSA